ncbi:MAG: PA2169 family four-helix-bundle protein [Burkholderiales bacterium]|nr:PA2169 family four-helix-bundle protein [Burkholderiales bacterium]MBA3768458.1 PA2169 family four-helix-bundle protein [Acidobacteriota bacterium]
MDNDKVVSTLNNLIETCKDGEQGYKTCAENAKDSKLKSVFNDGARRCAEGARELQSQVGRLGGDADTKGSVSGAVHRGWVNLKASITGKDDKAILNEAERGEDVAKKAYKEALETDLPSDLRIIVQRQYEGVMQNHDNVKALRDSYRAT